MANKVRGRMVSRGILDSQKVSEISACAFAVYVAGLADADREGRLLSDNVNLVRLSGLFGITHDWTRKTVAGIRDELYRANLWLVYGGGRFAQIVDFHEHNRTIATGTKAEKPSVIPRPPEYSDVAARDKAGRLSQGVPEESPEFEGRLDPIPRGMVLFKGGHLPEIDPQAGGVIYQEMRTNGNVNGNENAERECVPLRTEVGSKTPEPTEPCNTDPVTPPPILSNKLRVTTDDGRKALEKIQERAKRVYEQRQDPQNRPGENQ